MAHEVPISHNIHTLIRALDILDRIETYKKFLGDVGLSLQTDGAVGFVGLEPRPRMEVVGEEGRKTEKKNGGTWHSSGVETDGPVK